MTFRFILQVSCI